MIRKVFHKNGVDEIISTRRLDCQNVLDFQRQDEGTIELCAARFDDDTKDSFMNLYTKIDAGVDVTASEEQTEIEDDDEPDVQF